ncbi:MAG: single-stranded DNA-binding protein [Bacteroidia bacterium]|nr:single-stranded DNA-binding protein [Bacteroidia bacterium]
MAVGLNKIQLIGYVGKDPEYRVNTDRSTVATFDIGVRGIGKNTETIWFSVQAWDKKADIVNDYVRKGDLVFIEGSVKSPRAYILKHDGSARAANIEVRCQTIQFLNSASNEYPGEYSAEYQESIAYEGEGS